jgi:hypothetical protein
VDVSFSIFDGILDACVLDVFISVPVPIISEEIIDLPIDLDSLITDFVSLYN